MSNNKRPTQRKYLDIGSFLEYRNILDNEGFFSEKMIKFLADHELPTPNELSEYNLRVYVNNSVEVNIYNMNEITNAEVNVH